MLNDVTNSEQMVPMRRVRNLPRQTSEIMAPTIDERLELPDHIVTTLTRSMPFKLYFVRRYTVMFATRLIDANFSNDSFPENKKARNTNNSVRDKIYS